VISIMSFPTLSTARLRLRAVTMDDAPAFQRLLSIPEVTRYNNWPDAPAQEAALQFVRNMSELFGSENGCAWIIEEGTSNEFVGAIRFNYFIKPWKCGGVGYETDPRFWGRGLMSEALRAVVRCGHDVFGLNRIEAWTLRGNPASDRVLEKNGFQFEGVQRQKAWFKDAFHDWRFFARIAADPLP
jgi:[ribosomal protein S5]-alanine N-acetyltransferase